MSAMIQERLKQGQAYWQQRNPRERKMLAIWSLAVVLAILYFGIYSPLSSQIAKLSANVPRLEGHLFAMRGSKPDAVRAKTTTGDLRSAVFAALSAKKISADVRSISTTQLELRSSHPSVNEALQMANSLKTELAAQVISIQIKQDNGSAALVLVLERT
ncbi:MAG: type II secretion system protein GspM [Deefgea sp.]